jgi:hypothetical protein
MACKGKWRLRLGSPRDLFGPRGQTLLCFGVKSFDQKIIESKCECVLRMRGLIKNQLRAIQHSVLLGHEYECLGQISIEKFVLLKTILQISIIRTKNRADECSLLMDTKNLSKVYSTLTGLHYLMA